MFVTPKKDCPHTASLSYFPLEKFVNFPFQNYKCDNCDENKEIWICLTCAKAFCSRYINNHYMQHLKENPTHCICVSLMDLSVWCYSCNTPGFEDAGSYIENEETSKYVKVLSDFKFGSHFNFSTDKINENLNINYNQATQLKYQNFIELFKNKKFKKISFLLGAGISTSAGIPDFRSENGFFSQIKSEYNLTHPEDLFSLELFKKNPQLLYKFLSKINIASAKPTLNHYFMKYLQDKGWLDIIFTQNVDGLEESAGIEKSKIVFSHGILTEGHCANCKENIPIAEIRSCMVQDKIKYCPKCNGPCKPKMILYGEDLPSNFYQNTEKLFEADAVFIIGTSLKVEPFASLVDMINEGKCWTVLINKAEVLNFRFGDLYNKNIFLEGLCDNLIEKILKDCGWYDEFISLYGSKISKPIGEGK